MKRKNPAIERLRTITLFSACTTDELAFIASRINEYYAGAGDVLTIEGGSGREFLVIVEGVATVRIGGRPIARLEAGDFFGEIALLDKGPRTATVVAETDLVAEISSSREFAELIAGAPNLARKLLVGLAQRLRAADRELVD